MKVFIQPPDANGTIWIQARAEADDDSGTIGDLTQSVKPGGEFLGKSYAELAQMEGEQDIDEPEPEQGQ